MKCDGRIGSTAADAPVIFDSDTSILTPNRVDSRLREIWLVNKGPD